MKHREKQRLARRNLTKEELKQKGLSIFTSSFWDNRAFTIRTKIAKRTGKSLENLENIRFIRSVEDWKLLKKNKTIK